MQETQQHRVDFVSLGEGNHGFIGPSVLPPELAERARADIGNSEYERPASMDWDCVDMRYPADARPAANNEAVAAHVPGGLVITDAAADLMLPDSPKLSQLIVANTQRAIEDGQTVTVHGSTHAGKTDCGANKLLANRQALLWNLENAAVVAPLAWDVAKLLDLPILVDDISTAITNGARNAANDELWDVAPEQVVDLIITNGGRYEKLAGEHHEAVARVQTDDGSFDKVGFAQDHQDVGAFAASLGRFKQYTFERYGDEQTAAAQHVLGAVLFTIAVCKGLGNDSLDVAIVQSPRA